MLSSGFSRCPPHAVTVGMFDSTLPLFSSRQSGDATYYNIHCKGCQSGQDPSAPIVSCSLAGINMPKFARGLQAVAINDEQYAIQMSQPCGMCIQVESQARGCTSNLPTNQPLFVFDKCPGCVYSQRELVASAE